MAGLNTNMSVIALNTNGLNIPITKQILSALIKRV
jgi:hypothetical protein